MAALVSSLEVGTDANRLTKYTGFSREFIRNIRDCMTAAGQRPPVLLVACSRDRKPSFVKDQIIPTIRQGRDGPAEPGGRQPGSDPKAPLCRPEFSSAVDCRTSFRDRRDATENSQVSSDTQ